MFSFFSVRTPQVFSVLLQVVALILLLASIASLFVSFLCLIYTHISIYIKHCQVFFVYILNFLFTYYLEYGILTLEVNINVSNRR